MTRSHRSEAHGAGPRALALAMVAAAALAIPGHAASPLPADAGTPFASKILSYALTLPPGWTVVPSSEEPGSQGEAFEAGDAVAGVGMGHPEPGQTVEDRVAFLRAQNPAECVNDPATDRPTTLGGEPAILWAYRCPTGFHIAVTAFHGGDSYRLSVDVPVALEAMAGPVIELLRSSFRFTQDGGVEPSPAAVADLAAIEAALQGTFETAWRPVELEAAVLEAAGLSMEDADPYFAEYIRTAKTSRAAVKFDHGDITQYSAVDGGPLEVGWLGDYTLVDERTIEASEKGVFNRIVYDFTLRDGILTIDVVSDSIPQDLVAQTAIYETLPFTRVP